MAKVINRFSAKDVAALVKDAAERTAGGAQIKPQLLPDGAGLYLQIGRTGGASWSLKFMLDGKARQMGLGGYPLLGLADARLRAREARQKLLDGIDPIDARKAAASDRRAKRMMTFKEAAKQYQAEHAKTWSDKHAQQWASSLAEYAYPSIGALGVADITDGHIIDILKPIWAEKTQTAVRLRTRLEAVIGWAEAHKLREGPNPARWKGFLEHILAKPKKIAAVKPMEAVPYGDVPAFMKALRGIDTIPARALEFLILTAARSGEVMGAMPEEFNLDDGTWLIPAARMKKRKAHLVPLCPRAIEIIRGAIRIKGNPLMFPASKGGGRMSTDSMLDLVKAFRPGATVHGFRSAFRDWAGDVTNFQREVIEAALAHQLGDATEKAYRRSDAFEKRCKLMTAWAGYLAKPASAPADNVHPMKAA